MAITLKTRKGEFLTLNFSIYAQPIVELNEKNEIIDVELLTRFHTETGEEINPEDIFLSVIETHVLDIEIFKAIMENFESIKDKYPNKFFLSINVSYKSVEYGDYFLDSILKIMKNYSISPNQIYLELDENSVVGIKEFIQKAQSQGFGISIDDIGAKNFTIGKLKTEVIPYMDNLNQLRIKIDKLFITDILNSSNLEKDIDLAFISMILAIKNTYPKITVIAEGVEDKKTAEFLQTLGICYGQGYYFGKPKSFDTAFIQLNFIENKYF